MGKYICTVCDWVYDPEVEGKSFEDESEDFVCPLCGVGKEDFIKDE